MSETNDEPREYSDIYEAVVQGDLRYLKRFFDEEPVALVNEPDNSGNTLLSYAIYHRHDNIVHYLLSREDIEIHRIDSEMDTPMSLSIQQGSKKYVEMLCEHPKTSLTRCLPRFSTGAGLTPLEYAERLGQTEIVKAIRKIMLRQSRELFSIPEWEESDEE